VTGADLAALSIRGEKAVFFLAGRKKYLKGRGAKKRGGEFGVSHLRQEKGRL